VVALIINVHSMNNTNFTNFRISVTAETSCSKGAGKGKCIRGAHRFMEEFDCRQNIASIVIKKLLLNYLC